MSKITSARRYPLEGTARVLIAIAILLNLAVWAMVGYYYQSLPQTIPTHFGLNGTPDAYGSRTVVLLEPTILTLLVAGFLVALRFRYTLLFNYPWAVRLPAFVYGLMDGRNAERQGRLLNKVFTVYTVPMVMVSMLNLLISYLIIFSTGSGRGAVPWLECILAIVAVMVAVIFLRYRAIYREFKVR